MAGKITKIETQKKAGRYNIYVDEVYAFPVSESVLIQFRLQKGLELTDELIQEIEGADDLAKAYQRALNYLSYQLRSEKELRDYLKKNEITSEGIDFTIDKLKELRLIDDVMFAKSLVSTLQNTSDKGPKVIKQKLFEKGIKGEIADEAVAEVDITDLIEKGLKLAEKLDYRYRKDAFRTKQQKIRQQLMVKGYQTEAIDEIMEQLDLNKDPEDELALVKAAGEKLFTRNKKLKGRQLEQKVKQGLFQKGFSGDEINSFLDEREEE